MLLVWMLHLKLKINKEIIYQCYFARTTAWKVWPWLKTLSDYYQFSENSTTLKSRLLQFVHWKFSRFQGQRIVQKKSVIIIIRCDNYLCFFFFLAEVDAREQEWRSACERRIDERRRHDLTTRRASYPIASNKLTFWGRGRSPLPSDSDHAYLLASSLPADFHYATVPPPPPHLSHRL